MHGGEDMRTTLDLPEKLMAEALRVAHCKTKTKVITMALEGLIRREKLKELKNYQGAVSLDIDLDRVRGR